MFNNKSKDKMLVHKVNFDVIDSSMFSGSLGSEGNKKITPTMNFPEKIKTITELQDNKLPVNGGK